MVAVPCAHDCSQVQLQTLAVELPRLNVMIETKFRYSDLAVGKQVHVLASTVPSVSAYSEHP